MCDSQRTLGQHLATRLTQIGIDRFFGVPGDYNLSLLDELEKEADLAGVWCCNELNAGYAADGYARAKGGPGCLVVTFTVGGLSAINAVAGCYAENLPVLCVTGGPNSNDFAADRVLHHTTGQRFSFLQELECFKAVTCEQVVIHSLSSAHELIDRAIAAALHNSKPVYICICCNLAALPHPSFSRAPSPYILSPKTSNPTSLKAAVDAAVEFLSSKQKPVLVGGSFLRVANASSAFMELVDAMGAAFAFMPAAKGLLPESHPSCMGTYWGQVSSPCAGEVVESADAYLFAGPQWNDYATAGYSLNLSESKMLSVGVYRVSIAGGSHGRVFGCVRMDDFLRELSHRIPQLPNSLEIYRRMFVPPKEEDGTLTSAKNDAPLQTKVLYSHLQHVLNSNTILIAETGDAVFNCQKLRLPEGCMYQWSQQYGSIGWSVGATLGASMATKRENCGQKRVLSCIGDGSFQMTCQDVSTMLRYRLNPIIILINNGSYTIEVQIHDGPYNVLNNWDYVGLVKALDNKGQRAYAARATTEGELRNALEIAFGEASDKMCLIEAVVHKDDCSVELLEWGSLVSKANARPPA